MGLAVLVVNAGSSSLKLRLIGPDDVLMGARDLPPQPEDLAAELTALGAPDAVATGSCTAASASASPS